MTAATTDQATKARTARSTRVGVVTSDVRDKTIRVSVGFAVRHAKYGKFQRRETILHAHDEKNEAKLGDTVEVAECRPISKTKSWRLVKIVSRGAGAAAGGAA